VNQALSQRQGFSHVFPVAKEPTSLTPEECVVSPAPVMWVQSTLELSLSGTVFWVRILHSHSVLLERLIS